MNSVREMTSLMEAGARFTQIPFEELFEEWANRQGTPVMNRPSGPAYHVTMV